MRARNERTRHHSRHSGVPAAILLVIAVVSQSTRAQVAPQKATQPTILLTDRLTLPVPTPWIVVPKTTRGLEELVRPKAGATDDSIAQRVSITNELRVDHSDALTRLKEIEAERTGQIGYAAICGWPALERTAVMRTPRVMAEREAEGLAESDAQDRKDGLGDEAREKAAPAQDGKAGSRVFSVGSGPVPPLQPPTMLLVTVAVAAGNEIARFDSALSADASQSDIGQVTAIATTLVCADQPLPGQTPRELGTIRLLRPVPAPAPIVAPPPPVKFTVVTPRLEALHPIATPVAHAPTALPPIRYLGPLHSTVRPALMTGVAAASQLPSGNEVDFGELQIAVANDGLHVLVATNANQWLSSDGGITYTANNAMTFPSVTPPVTLGHDGDPTVGVGKSGNFYSATIDWINTNTFPVSCNVPVFASTSFGKSLTYVGNAVKCPATGANACFPDQEQMAVDRNNAAPSGDRLYMVWRNFAVTAGTATSCIPNFGAGVSSAITPTIACSTDGGQTWDNRTNVGAPGDDVGRPTVAPDGSVYVTYVSGANLMISKFKSCANALQPLLNKKVGTLVGVGCPVAGLDRCQDDMSASPQAAVDDTDSTHVMVAFAQGDGGTGPENVVVADSHDSGTTWPRAVVVHAGNQPGERFLPWICSSQGTGYVTWYDRRDATAAAPDLTAYYVNSINLQNPASFILGTELNLSYPHDDPQCASGWPSGADSITDPQGCPSSTAVLTGVCQTSTGTGSNNACNSASPPLLCTVPGETCHTGRGAPKYGDYNGNACQNGSVYVAWASDTVPATGVFSGQDNMATYTDTLSFACGGQSQACCTGAGLAACHATNQACIAGTCGYCPGKQSPTPDQSACQDPTGGTTTQQTSSCKLLCSEPGWLAKYYPDSPNAFQQCNQDCDNGTPVFKVDCTSQPTQQMNTCQQECSTTTSPSPTPEPGPGSGVSTVPGPHSNVCDACAAAYEAAASAACGPAGSAQPKK